MYMDSYQQLFYVPMVLIKVQQLITRVSFCTEFDIDFNTKTNDLLSVYLKFNLMVLSTIPIYDFFFFLMKACAVNAPN